MPYITIFDELIFEVQIDVMTINQLNVTLSTFLEVIVLFNLHSLEHLRGTVRHLHHQILCNLSSSGQPEEPLLIRPRLLIPLHVLSKYQLRRRAEIIRRLFIHV